MTTNPVVQTVALRHLAADAITQKLTNKAIAYGARLARDPQATIGDKIDYLDLLRVSKNADFAPYLAVMKDSAKKSTAETYALGRWMAVTDNTTNALRWLHSLPADIRTNQPTPLIVTDCLVANKDWKGLLALVDKEDWGEIEYYRLALTALAQRSLAQKLAFDNTWRKTLRISSHRLDRLTRLAQISTSWGWSGEHTEILRDITAEFPKAKWALEELIAQFYKAGDTRAIQDALVKSQAADPSDARLKNNLANVYLLRKTELLKAHGMAKEAYDAGTNDPFFISTYAYSLFVQDKRAEAVKVFGPIKPEFLKIPAVAAYYGVVQAFSGNRDAAKDPLALAEGSTLLPEEKELVRQAKAKL
jgi:Flp pilus assembly protein TadD